MLRRVVGLSLGLFSAGCGTVLGLDNFTDQEGRETGAGGTSGAATTGATSGGGGQGGGGDVCLPGEGASCYSGEASKIGHGACVAGTTTCLPDGSGFGPCEGEVLPQEERCDTAADDDCDDVPNEGCSCTPGEVEACYSGPAGTDGQGQCVAGTRTCSEDGLSFGPCTGEQTPVVEVCESGLLDEDCDGLANDGCLCIPGDVATCYTGPAGTLGKGNCAAGVQSCMPDGFAYGTCTGETLPGVETCDSTLDDDCNGVDCVVWARGCNGGGATRARWAADAQGNLYVLAQSSGALDFGGGSLIPAGGEDLFLAKFDPQGNHAWSHRFGDALLQSGLDIAVDGAGNVAVTGSYHGTLDFGGGHVLNAVGGGDIYVAKFGPNGACQWAITAGDVKAQSATGVAFLSNGDIAVSGTFDGGVNLGSGPLTGSGANDAFLARLSGASGIATWTKQFVGAQGGDVAVDSSDNIALVGRLFGSATFDAFTLTASDGNDPFIARFDAQGNTTCGLIIKGAGASDYFTEVKTDPGGSVVVAGAFDSTIQLGSVPLVAKNSMDIFAGAYAFNCAHLWSSAFGVDGVDDTEASIAVDAAGLTYISWDPLGPVDLGLGPIGSVGQRGVLVAKLSGGTAIWNRLFGDGSGFQNRPRLIDTPTGPVAAFNNGNGISLDLGFGGVLGTLITVQMAK